VYRDLAVTYQTGLDKNQELTRQLAVKFSVAVVLMAVELAFLLCLLAATTA